MRKLHVGGQIRAPGWEVLDAFERPEVDHVGNAKDLSRFEDGTFDAVYASHVVEHFDYARGELPNTLKEWNRVLAPGGQLYVSVPDMDTLCELFLLRESIDLEQRWSIMRMMFGGHVDEHDYHVVGLNEEFLNIFLRDAGFVNCRRVPTFGIFEDTSTLEFHGTLISLNMVAQKVAS